MKALPLLFLGVAVGCGSEPQADPLAASAPSELSCAADRHTAPSAPFEIDASAGDVLVCYGVSLDNLDKLHLIGFAPRVDNPAVLHHMSLLSADRPVSSTPALCPDNGGMATWRVVYGWAPGGKAFELPPEAGFAADPDAQFVVQLHYVNTTGAAQLDGSGFDLCTTSDLREHDADIMAFGTHELTVPARGSEQVSCSVAVPAWGETTRVFAAFPHMHRLGTTISTRVHVPGHAEPVDLGTVSSWNFDRQSWLAVDHVLTPGDVVETSCAWTNPYDHAVGFGPSTDDEMCYSFAMYYPRIVNANWHWLLPALYSECGK